MTDETLRFDAAINPYGCSPRVEEALVEFARSRSYNHYGEQRGETLRDRLADHLGVSPEHIIVYNGSGEALMWLFISRLLFEKGRLAIPSPTYERFLLAGQRCATKVVEIPLSPGDFALPVETFIDEGQRHNVTMALMSNPNNPSGNLLLNDHSLDRMLCELPECLFVIDEAYADYTGKSYATWVRERENLVILRTFSKAYGLAGLRIGYAVANPDIIRGLTAFQIPWSVDSMALVAAITALADQAYLRQTVCQIHADREVLKAGLAQISGIEVYPSDTNFFLIRLVDIDPEHAIIALAKNQIRVRRRSDMPDYIRITSLLPAENERLLDTITNL